LVENILSRWNNRITHSKKSSREDSTYTTLRQRKINQKTAIEGETSYGKLQLWLEKECGIKVSYKVVHDLVHYKLKADLKVPRPQSDKANKEVQASFKKKLGELIKVMIKYFGNSKRVRIWCQDESRFGLITMTCRMITLKG
jgi:transposase